MCVNKRTLLNVRCYYLRADVKGFEIIKNMVFTVCSLFPFIFHERHRRSICCVIYTIIAPSPPPSLWDRLRHQKGNQNLRIEVQRS